MPKRPAPGRPTDLHPRPGRDTLIGQKRHVGVMVVSLLAGFIAALREPFELADDLQLGAGGTLEAAAAALHGVEPAICMVCQAIAISNADAVIAWQARFPLVPFVLFGDWGEREGAFFAGELGCRGYVRRSESGYAFVASVRRALFQYR